VEFIPEEAGRGQASGLSRREIVGTRRSSPILNRPGLFVARWPEAPSLGLHRRRLAALGPITTPGTKGQAHRRSRLG
jgi:hypothetical protein